MSAFTNFSCKQIPSHRDQMQHQMGAKDAHIGDLEQTLMDMQTQMSNSRQILEEKVQDFKQ